jgi:uncharacterized glyoxalase superfamily protein PhnB
VRSDADTRTESGIPVGDTRASSLTMSLPRSTFCAACSARPATSNAVYERALAVSAVSVEPPIDTPYGDRRAMVRDRFGNVFRVAHVLEPDATVRSA